MQTLKLLVAVVLAVFALGACKITTSTNSNSSNNNTTTSNNNTVKSPTPAPTAVPPAKVDPAVLDRAKTLADSNEYSVQEVSPDTPKNTGGCTCAAKVAIMFQVPDKSQPPFRLCIGKDHKGLNDFSRVNPGDLIQFTVSETLLDNECADNPGAFLRIKTGE